MNRHIPRAAIDLKQLKCALSRWDNEGDVTAHGVWMTPIAPDAAPPIPDMSQAEIGLLHVRVIALENLVVALLAGASSTQLQRAHDLAETILPQQGCTLQPLTVHAVTHMEYLVRRADCLSHCTAPRPMPMPAA